MGAIGSRGTQALTACAGRDVDRLSNEARDAGKIVMKLDEKIFRLADSVDSEVLRMLERFRARIATYDDVAHDERNARLTYRKGQEIVFNAVAEEVATLGGDGAFSWGWAERPGYMKRTRKVEVAKSLFDELSLKQLQVDEIQLEDRGHAERLVRIVLNASRADGVFRIERGTRTIYYALFESAGAFASPNRVPTGKLVRRMTPSGGGLRVSTMPSSFSPSSASIPAARPVPREDGSAPRIESMQPRQTASGTMLAVSAPVSSRPNQIPAEPSPSPAPAPSAPLSQRVLRSEPSPPASVRPLSGGPPAPREPARPLFMPVAQAVFADITAVLPGRITQAVLIVNVRRGDTKTYSLEVVAMDAEGAFRAVEASRELRKIVSDMISLDETSGNGTWRRLVAYISMKDGAKLTFEVK
jgi:hypothetical protein